MSILLKDQSKAITKLSKYKVGALFMEPGTGKTRTAYELIKSVNDIDYVLWLTPFRIKQNLRDEIVKCGGFDIEFDVIGIETLSNSDRTYLHLIDKVKSNNSFVVCDESLKIKNFEAKRTKRIINIGNQCEYKLILNGTPLSRNVLDLWAQFEFLSPKILKMPTAEYKNNFCKYTTITTKINGRKYEKEIIEGYANIEYLYSLIKHYVYESNLNISISKKYIDRFYSVSQETQDRYKDIKDYYLEYEYKLMFNPTFFLSMIQKLQMCYSLDENKLDILKDILSKVNHSKTLVFCKFIASKEAIIKLFPDLRVLTFGKHAYGLNLQDYSSIIFFDKTLDYALKLQAERRIFRQGQSDNCTYIELTGDTGLEKMIDKNIGTKMLMLDYFKEVSFKTFMKEL